MTNRTLSGPKQRHQLPAISPPEPVLVMRVIAAIVLSCGLMQTGWAGDVTVQVTKRGAGDPVQAAAVCLGTPANIAQFGARLANEKGIVRFDKLHIRTELVLTVSKSGFKGRQVILDAVQRDRGVLLTLPVGGGGPECAKAVPVTQPIPVIQSRSAGFAPGITVFRINGGQAATQSPMVTLTYALTGEASHYRASDRSDFQAAKWQTLEPEVRYGLTGESGVKTVYFQVGKFASVEGAEIQSLSKVAVDSILLTGS